MCKGVRLVLLSDSLVTCVNKLTGCNRTLRVFKVVHDSGGEIGPTRSPGLADLVPYFASLRYRTPTCKRELVG